MRWVQFAVDPRHNGFMMNPYQSPMPIEEESPPWLRFLVIGSREACIATLGLVALLAAALVLLAVMPVAIGLAWYQYRKSWAIIDLIPATAMTLMLPLWQNVLVEAWTNFMHGRI
jgi:hypothetical protein